MCTPRKSCEGIRYVLAGRCSLSELRGLLRGENDAFPLN